jgi:uncharacterized damage-inducible protein DinB
LKPHPNTLLLARFPRPAAGEYPAFFEPYLQKCGDPHWQSILLAELPAMAVLARSLPENRGDDRYAEGKWSVKETIGHVIDAERVFAYRALCFARGESAPLPAFDQDIYVAHSGAGARRLVDLADEFEAVRRSTIALLASLDEAARARKGTASGKTVSVAALVRAIAGHEVHHLAIFRDRYGIVG